MKEIGVPVAKVGNVLDTFKKAPLLTQLTHLPLGKWLRFSRFLCAMPIGRMKNDFKIYREYFYFILAYSYFKHQKQYEYLIVDHGLLQQLGSLLHVVEYKLSEKGMRRFMSFVKGFDDLALVHCRVTEETALERMRLRKRDSGRIDMIMNDTAEAMRLLTKERKMFDMFCQEYSGDIHVLDMVQPIEQNMRQLKGVLKDNQ